MAFAFVTVALVYVIDGFGLPDDLLRNIAIAVLLGFGITLLAPPVAARVEAWISKWFPRAYNARADGGFGSGLLVGASLGFVYAPCAGPILAGVITVSASQEFTAGRLAVALAYAAGSALVLYLLLLGGRSGGLPKLGPAPDFTGTQRWFNTAGGRPLSLAGLRGKVVLIDFWTY